MSSERVFATFVAFELVLQPVNGHVGLMAFRDQQLVGILQLKTRNGLIHDLHAIAEPVKLAFVSAQLAVG